MHGWGHARNKGVTHLNLGNVPESQTDSSGFPTFTGPEREGLGWRDGFVPDGVSGWILCRLAGKMGSFGKSEFEAVLGGSMVGTGRLGFGMVAPSTLSNSTGRGCSPKLRAVK